MQQDSLWASAPLPVTLGIDTYHDYVEEYYRLMFSLTYSQKTEGKTQHYIVVELDEFEARDFTASLMWTADRYFWKNRAPRIVEREIRQAVVRLRAEQERHDQIRNPYREVVMP